MKNLKWVVILVLWLLGLWFATTYFSPVARDYRAIEKKVKFLRLITEQRELQFKILQIEARLKPQPQAKPQEPK